LVNQELLLQNEYLTAENRILKARLQPGWRLSDGERATLVWSEYMNALNRLGCGTPQMLNASAFSPAAA